MTVAFIPARGGSTRIPDKNLRLLGSKILSDWTMTAAVESGVFTAIYVVTDDERIAFWYRNLQSLAQHKPNGEVVNEIPAGVLREPPITDSGLDIRWMKMALSEIQDDDHFAILRPTSPFLKPETIRSAYEEFLRESPDSLRAVRLVRETPYKMWRVKDGLMTPLLEQDPQRPFHSMPTQTHPPVFIQTGGMEFTSRDTVEKTGTIAGERIIPFVLDYPESLDINRESDWQLAEQIVKGKP